MNWETLTGREEFEGIMDEEGKIHDTESIMVHFDDGEPTGLVLALNNGRLLRFHSKEVNNDGTRETLFASIDTPYKNKGEEK